MHLLWMKPLKDIYDRNEENIPENGICPIFFARKTVGVIVSITEDGDFVTANTDFDKKSAIKALIPITEESNARKNGVFPHAVFDNLMYVAGDYKDYFTDNTKKYDAYLNQLSKLIKYNKCPLYIKSIYKYIAKKTLITDLISIKAKKIIDEKSGELLFAKDGKNSLISSTNIVVFKVLLKDDSNPEIWNRKDFITFYQDYYREQLSTREKKFDIISEEYAYCSKYMPSNIRFDGDMTKLITNESPVTIGYESALKAFNALRWCFDLQKNATVDSYHCALFDTTENKNINLVDLFSDGNEESLTEELKGVLKNSIISGNRLDRFSDSDSVYFIAVDSDAPGRSSLLNFEELSHSAFLNNLMYWQNTMFRTNRKTGEHYTPNLFSLISYSFGDIKKPDEQYPPYPRDVIKKKYFRQLLDSVIFKKPLSKDFVIAIANKVNLPQSFKSKEDFLTYLKYAEMIIRKYNYDHKGDVILSLDIENTDRNYLFGRLLAVADYIEKGAAENDKHTTAAMRLWTRFRQDPANTWLKIRDSLMPYLLRTKTKKPGLYAYYNSLLADVEKMLTVETLKKNIPLSPLYIIGYNQQMDALYTKNSSEENIENN